MDGEVLMIDKLIPVLGEEQSITPDNGTDYKLDQLQGLVGGYIEVVEIGSRQAVLVVDEEGDIAGKLFNPTASVIARRQIVGNTVLIARRRLK